MNIPHVDNIFKFMAENFFSSFLSARYGNLSEI